MRESPELAADADTLQNGISAKGIEPAAGLGRCSRIRASRQKQSRDDLLFEMVLT